MPGRGKHRTGVLLRASTKSGVLGSSMQMIAGERDEHGRIKSMTLVATTTNRSGNYTVYENPAEVLAYRIRAALDPTRVCRKPRFLADMKPEEVEALKSKYGCEVKGVSKEERLAKLRKRRRLRLLKQRMRVIRASGHTVMHDIARTLREEEEQQRVEQASEPKKDEQTDDPRRS